MAMEKESIKYLSLVLERTLEAEENMESIIADNMPDIRYIICAEGMPVIRSKNCSQGSVSVTGAANCCVVYCPDDDGGVVSTELSIPYSFSVESEDIPDGSRAIAELRLAAVEARMVNPRKLSLRVHVELLLRVYGDCLLSIPRTVEAEERMQLRHAASQLKLPMLAVEKNFVAVDDCDISPEIKPAQIMCRALEVAVDEAKPAGSRLIVKGRAALELIYNGGAGLERERAEIAFEQLLELGESHDEAEYELTLLVSGIYAGVEEPGRLSVELHLVAEALVYADIAVEYLQDAYCPGKKLELICESAAPECVSGPLTIVKNAALTLETPYIPVRIISGRVRVSRLHTAAGKLTAFVDVFVLYAAEHGAVLQAQGGLELELEHGCEAVGIVSLCTGRLNASVDAGGISADFELNACLRSRGKTKLEFITEIRQLETCDPAQLPTYVLCRYAGSLWDIAKRFDSTVALICDINGIEDGHEPAPGSILLVPKAV